MIREQGGQEQARYPEASKIDPTEELWLDAVKIRRQ